MTIEQRASYRITDELSSWPGVVAGPGRRGEFAFMVGRRERIGYHPVFPGSPGFGARWIESEDDVDDVIALLRLNYERVVSRHGLPAETAA